MATTTQGAKKSTLQISTPEVIKIERVKNQFTKHSGDRKFRAYKDHENNVIKTLINPATNEPTPFVIFGGKGAELKLNNPWHKAVYEFLIGDTDMSNPVVWKGHPDMDPAKKIFVMINKSAEAKKNNLTRKELRALEDQLDQMLPEELMQFGFMFGLTKSYSYDEILNELVSIIRTPYGTEGVFYNVLHISSKLNSPDLDFYVLLAVLVEKRLIELKNGVYTYEGKQLDVTEDGVVRWFKDNPAVYQSLKEKNLAKRKEPAVV